MGENVASHDDGEGLLGFIRRGDGVEESRLVATPVARAVWALKTVTTTTNRFQLFLWFCTDSPPFFFIKVFPFILKTNNEGPAHSVRIRNIHGF